MVHQIKDYSAIGGADAPSHAWLRARDGGGAGTALERCDRAAQRLVVLTASLQMSMLTKAL